MSAKHMFGAGALACAFAVAPLMGCGDDGAGAVVDAMSIAIDAAVADAGPADASTATRFVATWNLLGGCLGGDEVELEVANQSDGRVSVSRYPCTAASGTTEHVGVGTFDVVLRVIDNDREMLPDAGVLGSDSGPPPPEPGALVAISDPMNDVASVDNTDTLIAFAFPTSTARVTTSWQFMDGDTAQSCADVGAVSIDLEYKRLNIVERMIRRPCTDLSDESGDLPTGLYYIISKALDGAGNPVRSTQSSQVILFVGNRAASATVVFPAPN